MERKGNLLLQDSDEDLVQKAKGGTKEAFGELVRRHQMALYRLAFRFTRDPGTADDIVQETFMKAYQKLDTFEGRSSFRSWIFRIAINNSKNQIRSNSRIDSTEIDDLDLTVEAEVELGLQFLQVKSMLTAAVQKLPQRQKLALMLRVYDDMSFHEIARVMGCTYDTAKAHFRHALLKLQSNFRTSQL